jgi:pimeloyl-ACP methyl ester carboxylesterase
MRERHDAAAIASAVPLERWAPGRRLRPRSRTPLFLVRAAMRWAGRGLAAFFAFVLAWAVAGAGVAVTASPFHPPGRMVDIGGRRMHLVCAGPADSGRPTVVFESGAFGFSADWAVVQAELTAQGLRSCAYDRAGLGFSDPAPGRRDSLHIVQDLEALLRVSGETGPFLLVGHSMAGIHLRLFADRNPSQVAGLVLVDATTPEAIDDPATRAYVKGFTAGTRAAATAASLGLMQPLRYSPIANKIGLTGEAEREKRFMFASGPYNRAAAAEVELWTRGAREAEAAGTLSPDLPVAVVTAGLEPRAMRAVQAPPALASRHGYLDVVPGARHDALLGPRFAPQVVGAVDFVLAAARRPVQPASFAQAAGSAGQ